MYFLEMLAHCDYIEHVLDPVGRREEQLPALGACIKKMASAPAEFTALLGNGLNAEAAVAAAVE